VESGGKGNHGKKERAAIQKETLPDNLIRRILESARFAPSTGNGQPWKFIVIKSPEIIAEMERDAARISKFFMFFYGTQCTKG